MNSIRIVIALILVELAKGTVVNRLGAPAPAAPRIIGGVPATPGEIPYIVSLQAYDYWGGRFLTCGGSLISPRHILTAAHCVDRQNIRNLDVVAGTHSISMNQPPEPTEQRREIGTAVVHPDFNPWTLDADVAVITVQRPFEVNDFVRPIELAPEGHDPAAGVECLTAGFGNVLNNGSTHFPGVLHRVNLNIVGRSACRELYASSGPVSEGMVCASVPDGGKGACHGDSGGPLVCGGVLVGSVSWGMRICARPNEPSVYANVGRYRRFVDEIISD